MRVISRRAVAVITLISLAAVGNWALTSAVGADSGAPAIAGVSVQASVREAPVSGDCANRVNATHQFELVLSLTNNGAEALDNVWLGFLASVAHAPNQSVRSLKQATSSSSPALVGELPVGATRSTQKPALTYCVVSPGAAQQPGTIGVSGVTVYGEVRAASDRHERRSPQSLPSLQVTFTPSAVSEYADLSPAMRQLREAVDAANASAAVVRELQARADRLAERHRNAAAAQVAAVKLHEKKAASHQEAVAEAERLAKRAEGRGQRALARAAAAQATAERKAERLAERAAAVKKAQKTADRAKRQADHAHDKLRAAQAQWEIDRAAVDAAIQAAETQ